MTKRLTDHEVISQYFTTLWDLDRSDESALTPNSEEILIKKRDKLEKEIKKRKLESHPYLVELTEASYK